MARGSCPFQISGHLSEADTPHAWAQAVHKAAGGTLLTVLDGVHASLKNLPCATHVVDFFRTGKTTGGTCPGLK
ncbi:hypothetical protein GTY54_19620 [Streptomyces sp. SID625]|nr:hypothetical protein [Streptomyces sp. SID625]